MLNKKESTLLIGYNIYYLPPAVVKYIVELEQDLDMREYLVIDLLNAKEALTEGLKQIVKEEVNILHPKALKNKEWVTVAKVTLKNGSFSIKHMLAHTTTSQEIWGLPTQKFQKVSMVMNSPNHWDGNETGNKHVFFVLDGCKNEGEARGFFNEFLSNELTEHRKVFEVLGSKMKVAKSDEQLSGLGFSSTQKNSMFCKVKSNNLSRTVKINF